MTTTLPRGIALFNPGNIEHGDPWQGLDKDQSDPTFCKFLSMAWGFRAMARNLIAYFDGSKNEDGTYRRKPVRTITDIVTMYAPPTENDTPAYIAAVAKTTGFGPNDALNLHAYDDMYKLCRAMTIHEQGSFEKFCTKAQLDEGLKRAGVVGVPVTKGGAIVSTIAATGAGAATAAAANPNAAVAAISWATSALPDAHFIAEIAPYIAYSFLILVGIGRLIEWLRARRQ